MRFIYSEKKMAKLFANSGEPNQIPHSAASDLGLHCLPNYHFMGLQTTMVNTVIRP